MRNTQFDDCMAKARAEGRKDVTRRLNTPLKPGMVCYHGEALVLGHTEEGLAVARYRRDGQLALHHDGSVEEWKWQRAAQPPRYCPFRCARLFSLVRAVYQEPLWALTEEQAIREGIARGPSGGWDDPKDPDSVEYASASIAYRALWNRINGATPWETNPLVYVIDLGAPLTRERAVELADIKDPAERLYSESRRAA